MDEARGDVPRNTFIVRALEAAVGVDWGAVDRVAREQRAVWEADPGDDPLKEPFDPRVKDVIVGAAPSFKCPVCNFRAKSARAKCPAHGRSVVEG